MAPMFFLECKGCPARIALPNLSPQAESPNEPYWPTGEQIMWVLCNACGSVFGYTQGQIHAPEPCRPAPDLPASSFWRATLECRHVGCGKQFLLHATVPGDAPTEAEVEAGRAVAQHTSDLPCPDAHRDTHLRRIERLL